MQGTVKFYNADKGFGFIIPDDGTEDLFFHVTQCTEGYEPNENDICTFEVWEGRDGRSAATQVVPTGGQAQPTGDDHGGGDDSSAGDDDDQEEEQAQE